MNFENLAVETDQLPKAEEVRFTPLNPDFKAVRLLANLIFFLLLAFGGLAAISFSGNLTNLSAWGIYFASLLVYGALALLLIIKGFKRKGYALRQKDILYKTGWIFFSQTVMPFNRIQHCELSQGPIEKLYNLCRINIFTAGGDNSDLVIPGLEHTEGERLRDFIMGKVTAEGNDQ